MYQKREHVPVDAALSWALLYLASGDTPDEPFGQEAGETHDSVFGNCENAARYVLREWAADRLEVYHEGDVISLRELRGKGRPEHAIYDELFGADNNGLV